MRRLLVSMAVVAVGVFGACDNAGTDSGRADSAGTTTSSAVPTSAPTTVGSDAAPAADASAMTTDAAPAAPAPPDAVAASGCDEPTVLAAIEASGAAEPGGQVTYVRCRDGFGWATYRLPALDESAIVLLSVATDGVQVVDLGTSVCALDHMPADVARAIAPGPSDLALDCPPS